MRPSLSSQRKKKILLAQKPALHTQRSSGIKRGKNTFPPLHDILEISPQMNISKTVEKYSSKDLRRWPVVLDQFSVNPIAKYAGVTAAGSFHGLYFKVQSLHPVKLLLLFTPSYMPVWIGILHLAATKTHSLFFIKAVWEDTMWPSLPLIPHRVASMTGISLEGRIEVAWSLKKTSVLLWCFLLLFYSYFLQSRILWNVKMG